MSDGRGMRMRGIAGIGAALFAGLFGSAAALAGSGIAGSPHDLGGGTAGEAIEICAFCHVPKKTGALDRPLWTHGNLAPGDFTAYGISAGSEPAAVQTYGISMVCLSCHDDVIAMDVAEVPVSAFGRTGSGVPAGAGNFADSHPFSISYNQGYDITLNVPRGGKVGELPLFPASGARDAGDRIECPSCHNPHEIVFGKFLRVSNGGSALCRNCHDK